jgi:hypothetical protein
MKPVLQISTKTAGMIRSMNWAELVGDGFKTEFKIDGFSANVQAILRPSLAYYTRFCR